MTTFSSSMLSSIKLSLNNDSDVQTLLNIMHGTATSAVTIWRHLSVLGAASSNATTEQNHFGEVTKKIDIFAKETIIKYTQALYKDVVVITEEDTAYQPYKNNRYLLLADPIDGSGHVRYHSTCGTFFSILPLPGLNKPLISGYALFGYQLILVLAIDDNLIISAYSQDTDQFSTLHDHYRIPPKGNVYSVCDSDRNDIPIHTQKFVANLRKQGYKSRYNGVLISDLHRIIMEGGIFLSPQLKSGKTKTKKYFEAIAIEHIVNAGHGLSLYEYKPNVDILKPSNKHELFSTVPMIIGSALEVDSYFKITEIK